MVQRLVLLKESLILAHSRMANLNPPEILTNDEWIITSDLEHLLKPIEGTTRLLCGDSYATISVVLPIVNSCRTILTQASVKSNTVLRFRACLVKNLGERFKYTESEEINICSTMLDPRFKEKWIC